MSVRALAIRVSITVVVMALALIGVLQVIERPVAGATDSYTAMFTDANGLRVGDEVRLYGVQVGKVDSLGLAGPLARVRFTVMRTHPLFDNSTLAVKYQNLTGSRYLEIEQAERPDRRHDPSVGYPTAQTSRPSTSRPCSKGCSRCWPNCHPAISTGSPPTCWR
ncbi:MlaD family protein [Nocardia sp. BMG111209]|uniref:MlaD family protein n=1 Tax=Nocardia sp. BMG111209 TaxID=1160137 RepID=UPI0003AA438D|nr:MlaD family protein [Nocardia sp. BMG111209]